MLTAIPSCIATMTAATTAALTPFIRKTSQVVTIAAAIAALPSASLAQNTPTAITGARIITGLNQPAIQDGTLVFEHGRIIAVGESGSISLPDNARVVNLNGKTLMPGLVNAHGHAGNVRGLENGHYSRENLIRQLRLYAAYGVTTVVSLGDDQEAGFNLRNEQDTPALDRSRLFVAGPVLSASSPEQAIERVDAVAAMDPNFIKIRVDDNLGRTPKMSPDVYRAFSQRASHHNIPLAVHAYYLEDSKAVIEAGADLLAHSVRDTSVDPAFIDLLNETGVCYIPTLTREVSTFVYESEPAFFSDPFFLANAEPDTLAALRDEDRQEAIRNSQSAQHYKSALNTAMENLDRLSEGGATIAMGTDSGPPARFQGYFEHMEMWMMQDAGLSPAEIIQSATSQAADCTFIDDVGSLQPGYWADFLILSANPLEDINLTRTLEQVWIAGKQIDRTGFTAEP